MRKLKVLAWHTHGSYLHSIAQAPHEFHLISCAHWDAALRHVTGMHA